MVKRAREIPEPANWPSEEEYFAGVTHDGEHPALIIQHIYEDWEKDKIPLIDQKKREAAAEVEEMEFHAALQNYALKQKTAVFYEQLMNLGLEGIEELKAGGPAGSGRLNGRDHSTTETQSDAESPTDLRQSNGGSDGRSKQQKTDRRIESRSDERGRSEAKTGPSEKQQQNDAAEDQSTTEKASASQRLSGETNRAQKKPRIGPMPKDPEGAANWIKDYVASVKDRDFSSGFRLPSAKFESRSDERGRSEAKTGPCELPETIPAVETNRASKTKDPYRDLTPREKIALGLKASIRMGKVADEAMEAQKRVIEAAAKCDRHRQFRLDRAHAVVADTLLFLEDGFRDLNYGGWMPFRYPDQWLMFCGLMRKVLAANGLITPKRPNEWRAFLEETNCVDAEEDQHPILEPDWKMPKSWAKIPRFQAIPRLSLLRRLFKKVQSGGKIRWNWYEDPD